MEEIQEIPQKSTFSEELAEIMEKLSVDQIRYVVARMDYSGKGEAAKAIGLEPNTVYKWPPVVDRAIEIIARDTLASAKAIRRRSLVKAISVKVKGLDSKDERIRQSAATELIEWELGKAQQKTDITSAGKQVTWKGFIENDNSQESGK